MNILNYPIEMIATTDIKGVITPHRFRFVGEDDLNIVIQIDKIIYFEKLKDIYKKFYYLFRCQSLIDNIIKSYEIKYELESCKWVLYKM